MCYAPELPCSVYANEMLALAMRRSRCKRDEVSRQFQIEAQKSFNATELGIERLNGNLTTMSRLNNWGSQAQELRQQMIDAEKLRSERLLALGLTEDSYRERDYFCHPKTTESIEWVREELESCDASRLKETSSISKLEEAMDSDSVKILRGVAKNKKLPMNLVYQLLRNSDSNHDGVFEVAIATHASRLPYDMWMELCDTTTSPNRLTYMVTSCQNLDVIKFFVREYKGEMLKKTTWFQFDFDVQVEVARCLALNPYATEEILLEVLESLSKVPNHVRLALVIALLLGSPRLVSEEALVRLAKEVSRPTQVEALASRGKKHTFEGVQLALLDTHPQLIFGTIAKASVSDKVSHRLLDMIQDPTIGYLDENDREITLGQVLRTGAFSDESLMNLVKSNDTQKHLILRGRHFIPTDVLLALSHKANGNVRQIALRKGLPLERVKEMTHDRKRSVREQASWELWRRKERLEI